MKPQSNSLQPHTPLAHGLSYALDVACFVFFALSLCLPSGYSYGSTAIAILTLAGCLLARPATRMPQGTAYLLGILLLMGLLWSISLDHWFSFAGWGYGAKYALAALSLWYLSKTGVRMSAVVWGLACGAAGALAIAAYQAGVLKMPRVSGFTNAIQFGGIAMYLGFATWVLALFGRWSKSQTTALGILGACAIYASFLSDSRGSWVVVPMLIVAVWCMAWLNGFKRLATVSAVLMVVIGLALAMPAYNKLEQRGSEAVSEVSLYLKEPQKYAETSVGQRLEQWRLALHLIEQRPLAGWGLSGYAQAKQEMVDKHLAHPSVMEYGHAHNEILDMWVKRGMLGLLLLLLFYAVPLCVFWPSSRRLALVSEEVKPKLFALRAAASLLPLAYFGFGWTQVFFAHNSGNMFYIFSLVALWGAICRLVAQNPVAAQPEKNHF
ncbi:MULTISPECIES: O-antigen ligase family protein [unclassified Comamonas]|uniref:O-antigen ligase family protein n=1 Tax=unclassified Comamonas TaxID=2638500 RepID=UPI000EB0C803|nr:O-antigen ligase family protein [Comamonas sp. lk]